MKFLSCLLFGPPTVSYRAPQRAALTFQSLESRDNPAGTVTAALNAGTGILTLNGTGADESVQVFRNDINTTVVGLNGTRIAAASTSFQNVKGIVANLGDDKDLIDVRSFARTPLASLTVDAGSGYDTVYVNAPVSGAVQFNLGRGDDTLNFYGGAGKITVNADAGNDVVNLFLGSGNVSEIQVNSSSTAGSDQDQITISGNGRATSIGQLLIRAGAQDDKITLRSIFVREQLYIHGGRGNDTVDFEAFECSQAARTEIEGVERFE